jgi:tRNA nucleotidyltransferase/poly(A) polymerase
MLPAGSEGVARRLADAVGGSFFFLDEERCISRVLQHGPAGCLQFDFTNFEGPDLHTDLARRDFTVNAMALDLRVLLQTGSLDGLIDPFGGREDLGRKRIRVADPKVLDEDPVRLLRAARFSATLGFSIDERTAAAVRERAFRVREPAPERVRDELFLILGEDGAEAHLRLLESLGLLRELLPELGPLRDFAPGKHHLYDIFTHSLRTAGYVDAVLADLQAHAPQHRDALADHLGSSLEHGISRTAALRFACLLHDIAKAETCSRDEAGDIHFYGHDQLGADAVRDICGRFRLARATAGAVERLVRHHMRPLGLTTSKGPSKRALYRYCRDLKAEVPESVVLSLADARATAEVMPAEGFTDTERTAAAILDYYYGTFCRTEARPFVTGKDLIARGMRPGPAFRAILEEIRERQAEGSLRDRTQALNYLERRW